MKTRMFLRAIFALLFNRPRPMPGQIYFLEDDDDPFAERTYVEVISVKERFVQYRYTHGTLASTPWSMRIDSFHFCYRLVKDDNLRN